MSLPAHFCWTRFGTEAGQPIQSILERKEEERRANGGTFFWGIGNAVGPSMKELIRRSDAPEVLFSPIKSAARVEDKSPPAVVAWTSGVTLDGSLFELPPASLITSRFDPDNPRGAHYALVCFSQQPLQLNESGDKIKYGELRNLLTGRPVGASQVTSIIQHEPQSNQGSRIYDVAIRARLVAPFLIHLRDPIVLDTSGVGRCSAEKPDWAGAVRLLWERRAAAARQLTLQGL
jgi:hypothetical protein